eukprot:566_1
MLLLLYIHIVLFYVNNGNEDRTNRHCTDTDISPSDILRAPTARDYICFTRAKWKNLKPLIRPTQPDVGYAFVLRKVIKHCDSPSNAQEFMNPIWTEKWPNLNQDDFNYTENTIPVIVGPTSNDHSLRFYAVDGHHHLSALDYSEHNETYVYLHILDDFRTYSFDRFIHELKKQENTYLYSQKHAKNGLPTNISFDDLPKTWHFNRNTKLFGDNIWRSLAGYARKVKVAPDPFPTCNKTKGDSQYCMRPFIRTCDTNGEDIPFFEFIWAYFFVDATYFNTKYWSESDSLHAFKQSYDKLVDTYYDTTGDWIDRNLTEYESLIADWVEVASLLVPLSRSDLSGTYKPLDFFGMNQLPGYVNGSQKVEDDPICSALPNGDDHDDTWNGLFMIVVVFIIVIIIILIGALRSRRQSINKKRFTVSDKYQQF